MMQHPEDPPEEKEEEEVEDEEFIDEVLIYFPLTIYQCHLRFLVISVQF